VIGLGGTFGPQMLLPVGEELRKVARFVPKHALRNHAPIRHMVASSMIFVQRQRAAGRSGLCPFAGGSEELLVVLPGDRTWQAIYSKKTKVTSPVPHARRVATTGVPVLFIVIGLVSTRALIARQVRRAVTSR